MSAPCKNENFLSTTASHSKKESQVALKNSKALHLWTLENTCWSDCEGKPKNFGASFLPPFQDACPKLPSSLNSEWPCWQGHAGSLPAIKTDFLSFCCGWKCSISVCDFNFTADWHLQRQRILIKLQEHLIQWLAGGKELLAAPFFWLC
jgi:hypothetical protein